MNVFLFPGQGSQDIGMAADLFKVDAAFRDLVRHASERVGADLERICLRGPERELIRTKHLQPLLVCVSLGYLRHLSEHGVQPDVVLGHSLGEITALAAAGVVTPHDAVDMAAKRGELMDTVAARTPGGMIAVTSDEREQILRWLATIPRERLILANENSPSQFVLSGELPALEEAVHFIATEKLGTCRKLPVAGPWHSPHMIEAQREFEEWLQIVVFRAPRVPVLFNVTATREDDPEQIRQLATRNLSEQVLWHACMERLRDMQATALFEIGPGRVLSGLARANGFGDEVRLCNVNNLRGVSLAMEAASVSRKTAARSGVEVFDSR